MVVVQSFISITFIYVPECGSSIKSCAVKKAPDMQIKTKFDSCKMVTSSAGRQPICLGHVRSKSVHGGKCDKTFPTPGQLTLSYDFNCIT